MTQSVFAKVKRRMDRALAGEDAGATSNLIYSDVVREPTPEEIQTRIGIVNWERAKAQQREADARIAEEFFAADSSKRKWGEAIAKAIKMPLPSPPEVK